MINFREYRQKSLVIRLLAAMDHTRGSESAQVLSLRVCETERVPEALINWLYTLWQEEIVELVELAHGRFTKKWAITEKGRAFLATLRDENAA
jgi:hypothetical protein